MALFLAAGAAAMQLGMNIALPVESRRLAEMEAWTPNNHDDEMEPMWDVGWRRTFLKRFWRTVWGGVEWVWEDEDEGDLGGRGREQDQSSGKKKKTQTRGRRRRKVVHPGYDVLTCSQPAVLCYLEAIPPRLRPP